MGVALCTLVVLCFVVYTQGITDQEKLARHIANSKYDKYQPPASIRFINVRTYLMNLWGIKDKTQFFSCDMVLETEWPDTRLASWGTVGDAVELTASSVATIWRPMLSFRQAIRVANQDTSDMRINDILVVNNTGQVTYTRRFVADVRCNMNFRKYPFDSQQCNFDVILLNTQLSWYLQDALQLPEGTPTVSEHYVVQNATVLIVDTDGEAPPKLSEQMKYVRKNQKGRRLSFRLKLQRDTGSFVFLHFIPLVLITGISLSSLFIDVSAAPARAGLAVTSLLSIITFHSVIQNGIPKVPYLTISGIFVNVCIIFVSANLVLFCLIFWLRHTEKLKADAEKAKQDKEKAKEAAQQQNNNAVVDSNAVGCVTTNGGVQIQDIQLQINVGTAGNKDGTSSCTSSENTKKKKLKSFYITVWCMRVPVPKGADHIVDKWARRCLPALYICVVLFYFVISPAARY